MKVIYTAVMARLKEQVPSLWVDLDDGVIDKAGGDRPAVSFPAALVSIDLPNCKDVADDGEHQVCKARVIVRIAQNPLASRTSSEAKAGIRESALERYDLIEEIIAALQGWGTEHFNSLSRVKQAKENRTDGLFVYGVEFESAFYDFLESE